MYKSLLARALVAGLSSCANPQQAQTPQSNTSIASHAPCPPGLEEYCLNQQYQEKVADLRVRAARQSLATAEKYYALHPDAQHAADLEEAKARLHAAVQRQEAGY